VPIAVDPRKAHNRLVVLDPVSRPAVEGAEFANTHAGYRQMVRFARRWRERGLAVKGCHGAERYLAQRLVANGEAVLACRPSWRPGAGVLLSLYPPIGNRRSSRSA
jgi:hypothetical protein